tara:strand:+ start:225 stop:1301 length:1077 start_codon:yes stop_codon:yes gene_type:complete
MPFKCGHIAVTGHHHQREHVEKTDLKVDFDRAERELAKRVPAMRRTSKKWFDGMREQVSVSEIEQAIIQQDPNLVTGFMARATAPELGDYVPTIRKASEAYLLIEQEIAEEMVDQIASASMASGNATWKGLEATIKAALIREGIYEAFRKLGPIKLKGVFDIQNPYVVPGAKQRVGWLIREVRLQSELGLRQAVMNVINETYQTGVGTRAAARQIRSMVGMLPHQVNAVDKIRARLVEQGMTGEALARRIKRETTKRINYRANMIARTEMRRAQATGRHDAWKVAQDDGAFRGKTAFVEWVAGLTERTCEICADLHGTRTELGSNFTSTEQVPSDRSVDNETPPVHPLCRCTTILRLE